MKEAKEEHETGQLPQQLTEIVESEEQKSSPAGQEHPPT